MRLRGLAAAVAALAFAGCGGGEGEGSGPLSWQANPLAVPATANLPDDRIISGEIENTSLRPIELRSRTMRLVDADGERVHAALGFIDYYAHGIFPPSRRDELATSAQQDAEDRRIGRLVTIAPGKSVPLTFSWRQPEGAPEPVRVEYDGGFLELPR